MAQFRATIKGHRGQASRLGHKTSGLLADINGWDEGVSVEARYDEKLKTNIFEVYVTGGSNHTRTPEKVIEIVDGAVSVVSKFMEDEDE